MACRTVPAQRNDTRHRANVGVRRSQGLCCPVTVGARACTSQFDNEGSRLLLDTFAQLLTFRNQVVISGSVTLGALVE